MRRLTPLGALFLLALPSCMPGGTTTLPATAPPPTAQPAPSAAQCRAERDRRLGALEHEEQSIRNMIDADAATIDAPDFQLRKTERTLLKMVQEDKDAVQARYRACLRQSQSPQSPLSPQPRQPRQPRQPP